MANRVNVNINVSDHSRAGLAALRQNMNRMQRDVRRAGGNINFRVNVDPGTARRDLRRIQRSLRGQPVTINTRLDPPTPPPMTLRRRIQRALGGAVRVPVRVTTRGLIGTVRGPLRALGGFASGVMQDGIGDGIIRGFKAGGPVGIAVLATLLIGAVSVLGAALSGLLVTALGLAFVGIGIVSAAKSKEVKAQWGETLDVLMDQFKSVGEPLIPVLDRALERLSRMAEVAGPKLRQAIEETAPATEKFINSLMDGFASFGENAFDRIMDAWNVFAPVFGEEWDEFMGNLGDAFGDMADLVKEHPTEIAQALDVVFTAIELLVRAVTFLGETWVLGLRVMTSAVAPLLFALAAVLDGFLFMVDGMLAGLQTIAEPLGLDGPIKRARENLAGFREQAVGKLNEIGETAKNFGLELDKANKKRTLEADIASWQAKLKIARDDLTKTSDQKAVAKLKADISNLENKIASARKQLNALNGKTATTYIITYSDTYRSVHDIVGKATGGVVGAAATGGVRNNLTLVGEQGPELVNLPTGSHVRSNSDTRRLMGGQGGGGGGAFIFKSSGRRVDDLLLEILREAIHQRGGDPVTVLGG